MVPFTAVIEDSIFTYEVKVLIDELVNYQCVYFGDTTLHHEAMLFFIKTYGEADLDDEVMTQYRREKEAQEADKAGEEWETEQLKKEL